MGSRHAQNLNINLTNPAISLSNHENVQIGPNNVLIVVSGIEEDAHEYNHEITHSQVLLSLEGGKEFSFTTLGPASISIGDHCTIAKIILNKELLKDLKNSGKFTATTGDNLVSVSWYDNESTLEQVEGDHGPLKIKFLEDQNTTELEKQVFELLADSNDTKLVQLITELFNILKAKLKHINIGCIEMEFDVELGAVNLQDKIKDLLRRTIIPEGAMFDLELQSSSLKTGDTLPALESLEYKKKDDVKTDEKDVASDSDCSSEVAGASAKISKDDKMNLDGEIMLNEIPWGYEDKQDFKSDLNIEVAKRGDLLQEGRDLEIKDDNLSSVTWYDNQFQSEQVEADYKSFNVKYLENQKTTELEKQVFELLADCKDNSKDKLVDKITELLNIHKAESKHFNTGIVNLQNKLEEVQDILRRTIIPEGPMFDLELQSSPLKANGESLEYKKRDDVMNQLHVSGNKRKDSDEILCNGQYLKDIKCNKNPGHRDFIPFKDLTLEDLPYEIKSTDILDSIKTMGSRVVRLVVDSKKDGRRLMLFGSGCVAKFNTEYLIQTANHVVATDDEVKHCTVEFNYDDDSRSSIMTSRGVELNYTCPYRDIAYFKFDPVPDFSTRLE